MRAENRHMENNPVPQSSVKGGKNMAAEYTYKFPELT